MAATLPVTGRATWTDRVDNWRVLDTDWIQDRLILRYAATPSPTPANGNTYYNTTDNCLMVQTPSGSACVVSAVNFLVSPGAGADTSVTLGHKAATGAGLAFLPTKLVLKQPLATTGDEVVIDATGIAIKTSGLSGVKLTGDATGLFSNKQITAPSFVGNMTATTTNAGALTATTGNFSSNVSISGSTAVSALTATTVSLGARLGQHINMYSTSYGLGIQGSTLYYRAGAGAAHRWYIGGSHLDAAGYPGAGGTQVMALNDTYLYVNRTIVMDQDAAEIWIRKSSGDRCIHMRSTNPYIDFWNALGAATDVRYGYIQGSSTAGPYGGILINPATGTSPHNTAGTIALYGRSVLFGKSEEGGVDAGVEIYSTGSTVQGRITSMTTTDAAYVNLVLKHYGTSAAGSDRSGEWFALFQRSDGTGAGGILQGSGNAVTFVASSDYRQKDDLGPVKDPIGKLMALQPKHLRWKETGAEFDGFIAHEVQEVAPWAVVGEKDAMKAPDAEFNPGGIDPQQLSQQDLMGIVTAATQDLVRRVVALEDAAWENAA